MVKKWLICVAFVYVAFYLWPLLSVASVLSHDRFAEMAVSGLIKAIGGGTALAALWLMLEHRPARSGLLWAMVSAGAMVLPYHVMAQAKMLDGWSVWPFFVVAGVIGFVGGVVLSWREQRTNNG